MGPRLVRDGAQVDEAASVSGRNLRALRSGEAGGEKESGGDDVRLELDLDEAKAVLLAYAQTQFPGQFDTVDVEASYGILQKVTFSRSEPKGEPAQLKAAA